MKVDEKKYNKKLGLISLVSIVIYLLIFFIITVSGEAILVGTMYDKADKSILLAANQCATSETKDIFSVEKEFPELSVAYFDHKGSLIITKGNYFKIVSNLGDTINLNKCYTVKLGGSRYRVITLAMTNSVEASKVKIYFNLEQSYYLKETIMLFITISMIIVLVIVVVVSYLVSRMVSKPYLNLAKKNNQLIYDTAHELNTPLAVINTQISNVVNDKSLSAEVIEELDIAKQEINRLKRMVKELLMLAKMENDLLPIIIKEVDVKRLINDLIEPYVLFAEMEEKPLSIDIDSVIFKTDEDKLRQIILIMLDNALKYTITGEGIWVEVKKEGDKLRLTIRDNGVGVPINDLEKIFEKFYRVDDSRTKSSGGTGIGLALLKTTVYKMGGRLTASQNYPKGLRLDVIL